MFINRYFSDNINFYLYCFNKYREIQIHVCDEVKKNTCDFTCPQELLISKMGYFANLADSQNLEDMDISVHCDIQVFEWLMKWVKYEEPTKNSENNTNSTRHSKYSEMKPILNYNNAIPIMVSANFLQVHFIYYI